MFEAIIASVTISLISLIGVFVWGKQGHVNGTHHFILPTAVGVFLGIVFLELIPETLLASPEWGPVAIMAGFLGFYLLSQILDTYHHHHDNTHADDCNRGGARKLLIGDSIHNFADGLVIATAFMIDPAVGVLTTIGIALHEIPQEIAEYGVLLHSGYSRSKALFYNFCSSLMVTFGVIAMVLFSEFFTDSIFVLIGIATGNLLYIATADLIPELRENHRHHFIQTFTATLLGVCIIALCIQFTQTLIE